MESRSKKQKLSILDLESEVNMEILSRVPMKTLFKCRCVCKTWKTLISNPHFVKLQFSRTPINLLYLPGKTLPEQHPLRMIDLRGAKTRTTTTTTTDCCSSYRGRNDEDDTILKLTMKSHFPDYNAYDSDSDSDDHHHDDIAFCPLFSYSCNGLLCLLRSNNVPRCVCNPLLGEYVSIPEPNPLPGWKWYGYPGFGFCSETNQYKVVWSCYDAPYETQIYTLGGALGERKWRSIGNAPYEFPPCDEYFVNTLVNGALYWVDDDSENGLRIRSFHFGREKFREVRGPAELRLRALKCCPTVGELGGCLSLQCAFERCQHLMIWVLKKSWTKDFVIDLAFFDKYISFRPIRMMDSGDILFFLSNRAIALYNPSCQSFRPLNMVYDIESPFNMAAYFPSFISLKDVAQGEKVKVVR